MSFKYSVIGDNTPENREHLEKLGYDISCPCVRFKTSSLFTDNDGEVHTFQEEELGECLLEIKQGKCDLINCIGNTQLFKAVSAMRDDSDSVIENGELWASVKEYPNYQVSHKGNIRSLNYNRTGVVKNMIPKPDKWGYLICVLRNKNGKKTLHIHRLISDVFIPNPNRLSQINHIDGDKNNNSINNLEWCSQSYNMNHAYKNFLNPRQKGVVQKNSNGNVLNVFRSAHEASRVTGINRGNISNCCIGNTSHAGGYIWEYATLSELEAHFQRV